jgi:hypothetical protein
MQKYYEQQNNAFIKQIKEEYNLKKKKYEEITKQAKKKKRNGNKTNIKKIKLKKK